MKYSQGSYCRNPIQSSEKQKSGSIIRAMANFVASPNNSRYTPFTQQPACCVPTCIQMVMHKNSVPLLPAEEIGYHLGLVVHPSRSHLFYKVRTSLEPPPAGYGTQIYSPEFEPNKAFKKLNIPLLFTIRPISKIGTPGELLKELEAVEKDDSDALLCFNHGTLVDDKEKDWGHVCVFDRIVDNKLRIVDPSPEYSKWRLVSAERMFSAMQRHGVQKSAGIWFLTKR